jgi:hypothetical protein
MFNPMYSRWTYHLKSGWTWVGDSHKEPYAEYAAYCRMCDTDFRFRLQTPQ